MGVSTARRPVNESLQITTSLPYFMLAPRMVIWDVFCIPACLASAGCKTHLASRIKIFNPRFMGGVGGWISVGNLTCDNEFVFFSWKEHVYAYCEKRSRIVSRFGKFASYSVDGVKSTIGIARHL